jgi:hypothetical protein
MNQYAAMPLLLDVVGASDERDLLARLVDRRTG